MVDIDDPFRPSDATIMRPRPGAGRRGAQEAPPPRPAAMPSPAEPLQSGAIPLHDTGLNPLLQAASPLLMLAGHLRSTLSVPDVGGVKRQIVEEIRRFEDRARGAGVSREVVTSARYALCACLDEAALSTPWGAQSEWAQQTLLIAMHREAWGGEKFFEMLEGISADPERHIDLMELQYMCLALGFAGKYHVSSQGHARLAEVRQDLYRRIRSVRGPANPVLSLHWKGVEDRRNPVIRYVPWWVVGAAALAIVVLTFTVSLAWLNRAAAPTQAALSRIGLESFSRPQPAVAAAGPTLRQLLADDERSGALMIEEDGALTRVTLVAPDLFASGSASVNAQYDGSLRRIAAALQRVPGRVLVVGHTDDQAIRSLRYRDNFELSRERAVSVTAILKEAMGGGVGIEWNGAGSSDPLFEPPSDPANRARNRRVEIVHVRES